MRKGLWGRECHNRRHVENSAGDLLGPTIFAVLWLVPCYVTVIHTCFQPSCMFTLQTSRHNKDLISFCFWPLVTMPLEWIKLNWGLLQRRRQKQDHKRHLKINILVVVTILRLSYLARILKCRESTLQLDWWAHCWKAYGELNKYCQ